MPGQGTFRHPSTPPTQAAGSQPAARGPTAGTTCRAASKPHRCLPGQGKKSAAQVRPVAGNKDQRARHHSCPRQQGRHPVAQAAAAQGRGPEHQPASATPHI